MKKILTFLAMALALSACVKDNIYDGVTITSVKNTIAYTEDDQVTVTANVSSLVEITDVQVLYSIGGAKEAGAKMSGKGSGEWTGTIPGAAEGTKVNYRIQASTADRTSTSQSFSYTVGEVPVDYSGLALNELNGNDKFIELFNKGNEDIRIKGIYIEKDGKKVWTAPSAIVRPGEYVLLYSTDVTADHADHPADYFFGSGLSAKKAVKVELFNPKGDSIDCFNLVTYSVKAPASYSRMPNGSGDWYFTAATPGAENNAAYNPEADKVPGLE